MIQPKKTSVYTQVVLDTAQKVREARKRAKEAKPIPFMQEQVSLRTFRDRFRAMSPAERAAMVQQVGAANLLRELSRNNARSEA